LLFVFVSACRQYGQAAFVGEKQKKRLKQDIKDLTEKLENTQAVTRDLVKTKQRAQIESEKWEEQKQAFVEREVKMRQDMAHYTNQKIQSISKYNVEMNNLRGTIKTLQKRIVSMELENEKLRETDSQSVLGSVGGWFGTRRN